MKAFFLQLIMLFLPAFFALSQDFHTPSDIVKIMESSAIKYEMNKLDRKIFADDQSKNLNDNNVYRVTGDSGIRTNEYVLKKEAEPFFTQAEEAFYKGEHAKARQMYEKVLAVDPGYYKVLTYIGQVYGNEGNPDKAMEYYKKAIEKNFFDYMAHWFLADIYKAKKNIDKAVEEITIAQILNRNNIRIKRSFYDIYKAANLSTKEWFFVPQFETKKMNGKVSVAFENDWIAYAMAKAVWKYEPGYRQRMGENNEGFSITEEKECLANLYIALSSEKEKKQKTPQFHALDKAVEKKFLDAFIFYEIFLIKYPAVVYQLQEDFIREIARYVKEVRGKEIK